MNGVTIREIAKKLGVSPTAAKFRLVRANITPKDKAGKTNIYDEGVIELIRKPLKGGRPKKGK
jgi:predicted ArsR family transcriptional regulator